MVRAGDDFDLLLQRITNVMRDAHLVREVVKIRKHGLLLPAVIDFVRESKPDMDEFAKVSVGVDVRTVSGANHVPESFQVHA